MNIVIFAVDIVPLPIKIVGACLAGLLPGIFSGRFRTDSKSLIIPLVIACVALSILLHQIVEIDPGIFTILGGFIIGSAVFLLAPSNKSSIITAITITLISFSFICLVAFIRMPSTEMRHAIAKIRQCGAVVQQSDNPGTTYMDQWSVNFYHDLDDDQLLAISSDLQKLPKLWLMLSNCSLGNRGLAGLADSENLIWLNLNGTKITDQGLIHLSNLRHLERLDLSGTKISDEGLSSLSKLAKLETLIIDNTAVTEDSVQELQKSLPKCKIIFGTHH